MANLREKIENELQQLAQELSSLQTNGQYLNQSKELVSTAINSLEKVNKTFQSSIKDYKKELSESITDWEDRFLDSMIKINSAIDQLVLIIDDLGRSRDQSLLPDKIFQESLHQKELLTKIGKSINLLSEKSAKGLSEQITQVQTVGQKIDKSEAGIAGSLNILSEKVDTRINEISSSFKKISSENKGNLEQLETRLSQQFGKYAEYIDRLKDKLEILQAKTNEISTILSFQKEKDKSRQLSLLIIGSIILLFNIGSFGILVFYLVVK